MTSASKPKMNPSSSALLSDSSPLSVGVDMGGTSVKFAVVQGATVLHKGASLVTAAYATPDELLKAVAGRVRELRDEYPGVCAVGMGLPGFVDHRAGRVDSLTNVPGWHNIMARDRLSELTRLPAAIDNDANCMAFAEWKLGAGQGMNDLVCLTLGTGVGSGVIVNGQFLRGHLGAAGEIGQMSIDYRGRIGHYGNRGAVEDYIGNREMAAAAQLAYAAAGETRSLSQCSPLELENAARSGCPIALQIWQDFACKLACVLMNCHYVLNPEAFIIGGGVAKAGDLLFSPLRRYLRAQLYPSHFAQLKLLPARFGNEAGLIGAARLALAAVPS